MMHIEIKSFSSYIPRHNLPTKFTAQNSEDRFVDAFRKVYLARQKKRGIYCKEFAVEGFGIADLIYARLKPVTPKKSTEIVDITAFEMKLKKFKKAISQAYRYSYFADRAIVVVPPAQAPDNKETLETLKNLGIGIWIFDKNSGRIRKLITPIRTKARLQSARRKACAIIEAHLNRQALFFS